MGRFERGDDPFGAAEQLETVHGLLVGDGDVAGAAEVLEVRMLGADTGIVEAGGDAVRLLDLAVGILKEVAARAVQDAGTAGGEGSGVLPAIDAPAGGFD